MSTEIRNYINQLFADDRLTLDEFTKLHELVTKTVCNVLDEKNEEIIKLFDSRKEDNNEI